MPRIMVTLSVVILLVVATAKSQAPPRFDSRLSVSTLVREDIFAGFIDDDMERLARGEKTVDLLLEQRPDDKPVLLAWQAGAKMYRAVRAFEEL